VIGKSESTGHYQAISLSRKNVKQKESSPIVDLLFFPPSLVAEDKPRNQIPFAISRPVLTCPRKQIIHCNFQRTLALRPEQNGGGIRLTAPLSNKGGRAVFPIPQLKEQQTNVRTLDLLTTIN